jgi:5'-nucleotidase
VREFEGVKLAFVGVTTREAALLVPRPVSAALEFRDEAQAVNALVPELSRAGVEAIVVLMHEGGSASGGYNGCDKPQGAIVDIVRRLDPAVDVVVSAHTHRAYICRMDGKLVTSAGNYGRLLTEIDLDIDRGSRDVVAARAVNHVVAHDLPPDGIESDLLARYAGLASPVLDRIVGGIAAPFPRVPSAGGETLIGRLVADAHLADSAAEGARIAFVNAGGVRSALAFKEGGRISFGEVHAVYPFENTLVTMTLSGAQILRALEQQWRGSVQEILQVSRGFAYAWSPARAIGQRVVPGSVSIDGRPLDPDASYRVTVNSFLENGGDGFTAFQEGRDRAAGGEGRDALMRYLERNSPVSPAQETRIRTVESSPDG